MEKNNIQTGMIMDSIANAPEDFEKNQTQVEMAIDNKKMMEALTTYKNIHTPKTKEYKIGRNDPCPCGSGLKFKKCCINKAEYNKYIYVK